MRNRQELEKIAAGISRGDILTGQDINDLNDLKVTFPTLLDMKLGDALEMINRGVHTIFQWKCKKENGVFVDWEELTAEEWEHIQKICRRATAKPTNQRRKRRYRKNVQKTAKN